MAFSGSLFAAALHLQGGLHYSPERAGLLFIPLVVGFGLGGLYWMNTVIQLGQVLGVSVIGTLFLSQVTLPAPAWASGHALSVTTCTVAVVSAVAAVFAHLGRRSAAR